MRSNSYVFRITVEEVLDSSALDFYERLLFDINLLQENIGKHDVFPSDASIDDYLRTLYVDWEILPPGERDSNIARILAPLGPVSARTRSQIIERYNVLASIRPLHFIRGTNEFRHYFGAQFADDLVVFENIDYGNAIYIMFEDWRTLSQKSRTELLAQHPDRFIRIAHAGDWKDKLREILRRQINERHRA
jgi:hypothetical protein